MFVVHIQAEVSWAWGGTLAALPGHKVGQKSHSSPSGDVQVLVEGLW